MHLDNAECVVLAHKRCGVVCAKRLAWPVFRAIFLNSRVSLARQSTLVKTLLEDGGWVCSADDYFMQDDERYVFDPKQIGTAHEWAQSRAALMVKQVCDYVPYLVLQTR